MTDLDAVRDAFVEHIKYRARIKTDRLLAAFASVRREHYLGEGPWRIRSDLVPSYWTTEDDHPSHLYHDVLIALDEGERLDNGLPSLWAFLIEALSVQPGERVVHIGCGTGYYTAILAELVGPDGHVKAIECEARFADMASANLDHVQHVTVVHGDGCDDDPAPADVILVNAGVTAPASSWLDRLTIGGRLLMPLTNASRRGPVLLITRRDEGYEVKTLTNIEIFSCEGARGKEASALLQVALWKEPATSIRSLRRDRHEVTEHCWLHAGDFCLSKQAL